MSSSVEASASVTSISVDVLEQLAGLAEMPEGCEKRRALLWLMTDIFLESGVEHDAEDRDFFGELMEEIAFSLERQVREELARKIAAEAGMPHGLIVRLANDEIPVARPVLEQSPVLTDDDLIDISHNRGQDHLFTITKRQELSIRLSTVLAERGNEDVVHSLLQNPTAKLSPDTIDMMASRSQACERIQAALVERDDVPREVLMDLLKHASEKVRKDIKYKLTAADEMYLDEVVDSLKSEISISRKSLALECVDALEQRNALNEGAILGFLRDNKPMEFLIGLSRLLSIDVKFALRVIGDRTGQALVVACRANRISLRGLKKIASSRMTAMPSDPLDLLAMTKMYHRITEENAQSMMRALRLRNNMLVRAPPWGVGLPASQIVMGLAETKNFSRTGTGLTGGRPGPGEGVFKL